VADSGEVILLAECEVPGLTKWSLYRFPGSLTVLVLASLATPDGCLSNRLATTRHKSERLLALGRLRIGEVSTSLLTPFRHPTVVDNLGRYRIWTAPGFQCDWAQERSLKSDKGSGEAIPSQS